MSTAQIAAFLVAMRTKGETAGELLGFARAMREKAQRIDAGADRLAIVALPCQIHALRALERRDHPAMKGVSLVIGLYCGNQLHFGATRSFLNRHGVGNLSEVAEIRYREGEWPGRVWCRLKDGRTVAVPKFHFNHLISFYVVERCLLCADLAAEGADVSVADAWDAADEGSGGSSLGTAICGTVLVAGIMAGATTSGSSRKSCRRPAARS